MKWAIEFDRKALKEISRLDRPIQVKIANELDKIAEMDNPRLLGKALTGNLSSLWSYRVGKYRMLCSINDRELVVLVLSVGHRKEVYK